MDPLNLLVNDALNGVAGQFGPDDNGDFAVAGRKLAWFDNIAKAMSGFVTPAQLAAVQAQFAQALADNASELSQAQRDAVVAIFNDLIAGLGTSVTIGDVNAAIAAALATLPTPLTEAQVKAIVAESMVGLPTIDALPTEGSSNLVTSGGVYEATHVVISAAGIDKTLSQVEVGEDMSGVTLTLPNMTSSNRLPTINFTNGAYIGFSADGISWGLYAIPGGGYSEWAVTGVIRMPSYTIGDGYIVSAIDEYVPISVVAQNTTYTSNPLKKVISILDLYNLINREIPVYKTTADFQAAIQSGEIKPGDAVYVEDAKTIAYMKDDGSLNTLGHEYADGVTPYLDVPLLLNLLCDHIENDKGYWETLQLTLNQVSSLQTMVMALQASNNDLRSRVAILEEQPEPIPDPVYDMTTGTVLHSPPLIGLLGLEILGVDKIGNGWTAPYDGLLVVDNASLVSLLTDTWIAVNGVKAAPEGSLVVLQIIGGSDGAQIPIVEGDIITQSGMGNITYYKRTA